MKEWVPILTHYPGKIVSFDPVKQVAKVQVMREQFTNTLYSLYEEYEFPVLQNVPVQFPQGGGYCLTFPVAAGDNCILHFCDKGISHWLQEGKGKIGKFSSGVPKADYFRSYSINDAVAIVGFNPIPNAITNFNATAPELRNSDASQRVTLNTGGVMEVVTPTELHITAPQTVMDGNMKINGNLHVTGLITSDTDVKAKTVSLINHIQTGVTPGPLSSVSGPPQV